jgi:leucyl aminopeptidase (aminopeptidase T)
MKQADGNQPVTVNSGRQERQFSMSIQEVSAEQLAQLFHHYHQALASDFERRTEQADRSWEDIPQQERERMTAAARLALLELDSMEPEKENARPYFARPGEAEWGC